MPESQPTPKFASKGSQRWLQLAVNRLPEAINDPIRRSLGLKAVDVHWKSPLEDDGLQEYRDMAALERLGVHLTERALPDFWPARGPMWDGLALLGDQFILVEAKAHIAEVVSPRSRAGEPALQRIRESMTEVQKAIASKSVGFVDWTGTFYQYANRLAHLYLLRELNREPVHLVNIYFLNAEDVGGPSTRLEWEGALKVVRTYLGVGRHRLSSYCHDVYVDVKSLSHVAE